MGTGGVHSHADHWFGVLDMAKHMGADKVYLHCIMDGRDTDPHSGEGFLADLQAKLDELGIGQIATVTGRYYAMDRDKNWDREEKAYAAFVYGEGSHAANAKEAIEKSYADGVTDEFVVPVITCEGGRVQEGDTVIFMNFRPDRARQMTRIFVDDDFDGFERRYGRFPVNYVCMAEYDATMPNVEVAYPPMELKNVLGEYLSAHGKTQLRIAETEKYAHVTFFFNGGVEAPYEGEDRKVIPSPKVATYDLKPEMSAPTRDLVCAARIESGKYDVVILNFANCDMVGHTGVFDAAVKAVEAVDAAVGKVVDATPEDGRRGLFDRRPRQRREDEEPRRHPLHRPHHQRGALCGDRRRRRQAARGRLPGRHRPHHAALYRPAGPRRDDRQEHHRRVMR